MIFYFDRETGKRVSKATWSRSKSHGGSRYVRRRSEPRQTKNPPKVGKNTPPGGGSSAPSPSETPRTWQEYQAFVKANEKKRRRFYDEDFEGIEYESSVDY